MARITGVGSLPHNDPSAAAEFVLQTSTVPYLPQLPNRHPEEGMLAQWGDGVCGCGFDATGFGLRYGRPEGPRHEAFVGADAMLRTRSAGPLKTQATGPVTLGLAMLAGGHPRRGLWDCLVPALATRVQEHLEAIAAASPAAEVTLVVDEPALGAVTTAPEFPVSRREAAAVIRAFIEAVGVRVGIHCCAEADWPWIVSLGPAAVSWDLMMLAGFGPDADAVGAAISAGMEVMWGLVPAAPSPVSGSQASLERYRQLVAELVVAGVDVRRLREDAWFSPACGLAGLTEGQAEWVMDELHEAVAATVPG